mgnify:CR=1 FL=1
MKKLKKLLRRFSVRHNLGLKIHLAREDVLEELLKTNGLTLERLIVETKLFQIHDQ